MLNKAIGDITPDDIHQLVADKVVELRTLEYKATTPGSSDEEKKEFLADVSSFANASGGQLLYGVSAERDGNGKPTGAPDEACGVTLASTSDAEVLRLDNILRDGLDPRIPGLNIRALDGFTKGPVIIIHVPRSFAAPHMVKFKGGSRFFARNSAGKYQLDVGEIRASFVASEAVADAPERFRQARIGRLLAGSTPVPLSDDAKVVLHVFPLSAARPGTPANIVVSEALNSQLRPLATGGWNYRFNLDGYLTWGGSDALARSYVQLFRNGCVEAVTTRLTDAASKQIFSPALEETMSEGLARYAKALALTSVDAPLVVMLTLAGVRGYSVRLQGAWFGGDIYPIEHEVVAAPEVLMEDLDAIAVRVLQPVFDVVWQASGVSRCPLYDISGNWVEQR